MILFFAGLASVALSLALSEWIGNTWAGFLAVSCLYLLIGAVVWAARGKIIRMPVMNALIKQLFGKGDENN